jgi:hypothetical protein
MFIGALVGGLLALDVDLVLPLIIAFLLMAVTAGVARRHSTARSDWTRRSGSG